MVSIYVRKLGGFLEVSNLKKLAFEKLVPNMHFDGGQRGNDWVECDCNGVLMKSKELLIRRPEKKNLIVPILHPNNSGEVLYPLSRSGEDKWYALHPDFPFPYNRQMYLGLGGSIHFGCHKVS